MTNQAARIAKAISKLTGIESAKPWTRVAGKERVYIEFTHYTMRRGDFARAGSGGGSCYYDVNAGTVRFEARYADSPFSNATTYAAHRDMDTLDAIKEAAASAEDSTTAPRFCDPDSELEYDERY